MDETLADDMAVWTWRRWRPWLVPALVRGVVWGGALALLTCTTLALSLAATGSAKDLAAVPLAGLLCLAAGLVGGAVTAPLEARARGRSAPARLAHAALSGGAAALGWVVVVAQVAYLTGVVRGGMERGLGELGRLVGGVVGGPTSLNVGVLVGCLLAVAVPFGLAVLLRLDGRGLRVQVLGGCGSIGCGGLALVCILGVTAAIVSPATGPGSFERSLAAGGMARLVALALAAAIVLAVLAAPLAVLAPLALKLADRLSPLPQPAQAIDERAADDQPTG